MTYEGVVDKTFYKTEGGITAEQIQRGFFNAFVEEFGFTVEETESGDLVLKDNGYPLLKTHLGDNNLRLYSLYCDYAISIRANLARRRNNGRLVRIIVKNKNI